jgi:hypothetical protein
MANGDPGTPIDLTEAAAARERVLRPGARVEVRNRFDRSWTRGFEVAESAAPADEGGAAPTYRVRRLSDGVVLNAEFPADEVRRERRRETWWIGM